MAITPVKPGTPDLTFSLPSVAGYEAHDDVAHGDGQDDASDDALALIQRINARLGASTITPRSVPQVA